MYKEDLALNNLKWLICHKTQPNQFSSSSQSSRADCPDSHDSLSQPVPVYHSLGMSSRLHLVSTQSWCICLTTPLHKLDTTQCQF